MHVLQHEPEQRPERAELQLADVDAVDEDPPAADVVEPQQQVDDRRLARSGGADDADALARLDTERDVAQHAVLAVVREPDVLELDSIRRGAGSAVRDGYGGAESMADRRVEHVKMRSEAAIAACRMLNFSDRSEIGWKNRREYWRNATSTPSDTMPSSAQPPPTQMISAPDSAASNSITG